MNASTSLNKKYLFPVSTAKELLFLRFSLLLCYAAIVIMAFSHNLTTTRNVVTTFATSFILFCLFRIFLLIHSAVQTYPFYSYSLAARIIMIIAMCLVPIAEIKFIKGKSNEPVEVYSLLQSLPTDFVDFPEQYHLELSLFRSLQHFINGYIEPEQFIMNCEMLSNIVAGIQNSNYETQIISDTEILIMGKDVTLTVVFSFEKFKVTTNERLAFEHRYSYIHDDKNSKDILKILLPVIEREVKSNG